MGVSTEEADILPSGSQVTGTKESYIVIGRVGEGARAKVYRVRGTSTSQELILKLNDERSTDEADTLNKVGRIIGDAQLPKRTVDVVDKVANGPRSLDGFRGHFEGVAQGKTCQNQELPEQDILDIAIAFGEVLQVCARKGIAYQDVKPLNHVFWEPSSKSVTVIDWNVAKLEAAPTDLRDDILKYCVRLPEFFTGKSQDTGDRVLHPLGWSLRDMTTQSGLKISYATWVALARLSLSWGGPVLPNVASLLTIPTKIVERERTTDWLQKQVDLGWSELLNVLRGVRQLWAERESKPPVGRGVPIENYDPRTEAQTLVEQMCRASVQIVGGTPTSEWEQYCSQAENSSAKCQKAFVGLAKHVRPGSQQHLEWLIWARLLNPQQAAFALALSVYLVWEGVDRSQDQGTWKELLIKLMAEDAMGLDELLNTRETSLRQGITTRCNEIQHGDFPKVLDWWWGSRLEKIIKESHIWASLSTVGLKGSMAERLTIIEQALQKVPGHPQAVALKQETEEALKLNEQVDNLTRELIHLLRTGGDPDLAQRKFETLRALADKSPTARRLIELMEWRIAALEKQRTTLALAREALKSADINKVNEALADLAVDVGARSAKAVTDVFEVELRGSNHRDGASVKGVREALNSILGIRETDVEKGLVHALTERRVQIQTLDDTVRDIVTTLTKIEPRATTEESEKEEKELIKQLAESAVQLTALFRTYKGASQPGEGWRLWCSIVARLITRVEAAAANTLATLIDESTLDNRLMMLERLQERLNAFQQVSGVLNPAARLDEGPTLDPKVRDAWDKIQQTSTALAEQIQQVRDQMIRLEADEWATLRARAEEGSYEAAEREFTGLPSWLASKLQPQFEAIWWTETEKQLQTDLEHGRWKEVLQVVDGARAKPWASGHSESLSEFVATAKAVRVMAEARSLLDMPEPEVWVKRAKTVLSEFPTEVPWSLPATTDAERLRGELEARVNKVAQGGVAPSGSSELLEHVSGIEKAVQQGSSLTGEAKQALAKTIGNLSQLRVMTLSGFLLSGLVLVLVIGLTVITSMGRGNTGISVGNDASALGTPTVKFTATQPAALGSSETITQTPPTAQNDNAVPVPTGTATIPMDSSVPLSGYPRVVYVANSRAAVFVSPSRAQDQLLFQYEFSGKDLTGNPISAQMSLDEPPTGGMAKMSVEFIVYQPNIQEEGTKARLVANARLRSPSQQANEGRLGVIYALLATLRPGDPAIVDVLAGPNSDAISTWYKVRLHGYIAEEDIVP